MSNPLDKMIARLEHSERLNSYTDWCQTHFDIAAGLIAGWVSNVIDYCGGTVEVTGKQLSDYYELAVAVLSSFAAFVIVATMIGPFVLLGYVARKLSS